MKKPKLTIEEHIELANDLSIVSHYLNKIFYKLQGHYNKSSRLMKILSRFIPCHFSGLFIQVQSELDTDWHRLISNDEFKEYGHIYYNLEKRFNEIEIIDPDQCGNIGQGR